MFSTIWSNVFINKKEKMLHKRHLTIFLELCKGTKIVSRPLKNWCILLCICELCTFSLLQLFISELRAREPYCSLEILTIQDLLQKVVRQQSVPFACVTSSLGRRETCCFQATGGKSGKKECCSVIKHYYWNFPLIYPESTLRYLRVRNK